MAELTFSSKQYTAFQLLNDPTLVELLFGGAAGGGKSLLVTCWAVIECRKYPGIRIGLGRKELSTLRKTTVSTLLTETHPLLGVGAGDFRYSSLVDPGIYYKNGSEIIFVDLAPAPSDPNYDRLGSTNLTHVILEEAGELTRKAKSVFASRKNRYRNQEYGITGKTILTCNPSYNFVREEFHDPYIAAGGGDMQKWEHGQVSVEGKLQTAYRAFVKSLPTDNPFLSANYLETLKGLPDTERRRLMEGDWDFDDDDSKLFKTHLFRTTSKAPKGDAFAGCDPARLGGDKTVFSLVRGNAVVDITVLDIPKDVPKLDIGGYVTKHFIDYCERNGVGYERAAVDVVGIGASVLDSCNARGFYVQAFNAGSTDGVRELDRFGNVQQQHSAEGIRLFNNIRSQTYYDMAQAAHTGEMYFLEDLPHYSDLKRDLAAHQYETKERQTIVESKDKLKARLGKSPDFSDSVMAAWWCRANQNMNVPSVRFI